ncbi:MAG: aminotransferase class I/II-fold pyridoxal phosphate-dependent enzyme [Chitinophagales bacterium]|nr:aminotransferase class I/II-fold pyridoxal phosphate-dependent enzyme [Hyphomicrobiales bacterium]
MVYSCLMTLSYHSIQSPFARLRALLDGLEPGAAVIDMTIGEPRHGAPPMLAQRLAEAAAGYEKYPPSAGITALRGAIAAWISRRYPDIAGVIDAERHILPLSGSREGLFSAVFIAKQRKGMARPSVLMPNPFYQAYLAAALAADAEPVFLPSTAKTGWLPDLDAIPAETLPRTAAFYLASPANPQGSIASRDYLARAIGLAREHGFMLFLDECYSEIYTASPPQGGLETAHSLGGFGNVCVFNSLSKRSNVPGLRSGFISGDPDFLAAFAQFRNVACPQVPLPVQHASATLWADETHVDTSRALYAQKIHAASRILGGWPNFAAPAGGFFLWLDMAHLGGGEVAAKTIWKGCGVKFLPGAYLAQTDDRGDNPGERYARLALVDSLAVTGDALTRISQFMG